MADHAKAKLHHGKAGDALKAGDGKLAAHHMGHALAALRTSTKSGEDMQMPAVSKAQLAAMQAAKAGKSTLGIPAKVGAEFVEETPSPKGLPDRLSGLRKGLKGLKK